MTDRRQQVLEFVRAYIKIHGCGPALHVIAKALELRSKSNIHRIVKRLEMDGFIQTNPKKYRSIRVVDKSVKAIASL
jgi:repressor LexA